MNHLKIVAPGFVGYTGQIGQYMFKDGISVEPIGPVDADRLSASVACVRLNKDGDVIVEGDAGPAQRLIDLGLTRADVVAPLRTATEAEMHADQREAAVRAKHDKVSFFTRGELEHIAREGGIKALRLKADVWSVRHRSIPTLIDLILEAQDEYKKRHENRSVKTAAVEDDVEGRPVGKSSDPMLNINTDQLFAQQQLILQQQAPIVAPQDEEPTPTEEPVVEEPATETADGDKVDPQAQDSEKDPE